MVAIDNAMIPPTVHGGKGVSSRVRGKRAHSKANDGRADVPAPRLSWVVYINGSSSIQILVRLPR
jgi:hypothetical protein